MVDYHMILCTPTKTCHLLQYLSTLNPYEYFELLSKILCVPTQKRPSFGTSALPKNVQ